MSKQQHRQYRLMQEGRYNALDDKKHKTLEEIGFQFVINSSKKVQKTSAAVASSHASFRQEEVAGTNQDESSGCDDE